MKYLGSEKHLKNLETARQLGLFEIIKNKENRIKDYYDNPNKCTFCCTIIKYDEKHKKFCNSSCAAKHNNKNRILNDKTKELIRNKLIGIPQSEERIEKNSGNNNGMWKGGISKKYKRSEIIIKRQENNVIGFSRKCIVCEREFELRRNLNNKISKTKTCSKECHKQLSASIGKEIMNERIANGTHKGWEKRKIISYPEQFFIEVLNKNEIKFEHNYPVKQKDLGLSNAYNFFLDFYIKDKNIDLEIDGQQHEYRKEHDTKRDSLLINAGYSVYRIKWKSINSENGKEYMKNEIDKFLKFYNNI
jgi:very-short-patch-repair endonuclease